MSIVIDASAAVEYLLRTPLGEEVATVIGDDDLLAPELLDAEVAAVLRREVMRRRLMPGRAHQAIDDLCDWPVERIAHRALLSAAWALRENLTIDDALYVAAAKLRGASVLTADGPLARAPASGVVIHTLRPG